jgi:NAD(P)-dependent dehydrogenase (short-subunit alcohol dehydrogenase family)
VREGADVAVASLNERRCRQDQSRHRERVPALHHHDFRRSGRAAFCAAAVDRTIKEFGQLDILINNAAFQEHVNDFDPILTPSETNPFDIK